MQRSKVATALPPTHAAWHASLTSRHKANVTAHCQNLLHQCTVKSAAHKKSLTALGYIVPAYLSLVDAIDGFDPNDMAASAKTVTVVFDGYMTLLRATANDIFGSESDFKTSAIPEFFLRLFIILINHHKATTLEASGQRDIPVELSFDIRSDDLVIPRSQRVDAAIVIKTPLVVADKELVGFCIPVFAAEAKTYFDKNMLSGVDQSAAGMKSTFPHCLYFSIGEFADFELSAHSYAAGAMDEIYILRHQKRADFRKTKVANPIDANLVTEILTRVETAIINHNKKRPRLDVRLKTGRLIG